MKILIINASYKPAFIYGGPTMSVSMLAEQLVDAGVAVNVFTTTADGKKELPVEIGKPTIVDSVEVTYFKRVTKDHTHFSPSLLVHVWKHAKSFDLVHIQAWWNLVSVLSCLIAIKRGVPVLLSPRGTLSNYSFQNKNSLIKNTIHKYLGIPLLRKSFIHTTSTNEHLAVEKCVSPKGIFEIPNFIRLAENNEYIAEAREGLLKLIFLSRIEKKKGLDILLVALKNASFPWKLTIAGDGNADYVNYLKSIAIAGNIADRIDWVGFQNQEKFQLLNQHDLLVLPSHDENFGNVVIESLSVGTAVLVSDQVGLAEYVRENNMGWICQADPVSVIEVLNSIHKNRGRLDDIRENGPAQILADFNEKKLVQKYITMYNQILSLNSCAAE